MVRLTQIFSPSEWEAQNRKWFFSVLPVGCSQDLNRLGMVVMIIPFDIVKVHSEFTAQNKPLRDNHYKTVWTSDRLNALIPILLWHSTRKNPQDICKSLSILWCVAQVTISASVHIHNTQTKVTSIVNSVLNGEKTASGPGQLCDIVINSIKCTLGDMKLDFANHQWSIR